MQSYIALHEHEVAELEATWKAKLSHINTFLFLQSVVVIQLWHTAFEVK